MTVESVEEFRSRARSWLAANMPPQDPEEAARLERDDVASWQRARELQKILYDGGFAGICFPREYGGLGLGYEYKKAFDAEHRIPPDRDARRTSSRILARPYLLR